MEVIEWPLALYHSQRVCARVRMVFGMPHGDEEVRRRRGEGATRRPCAAHRPFVCAAIQTSQRRHAPQPDELPTTSPAAGSVEDAQSGGGAEATRCCAAAQTALRNQSPVRTCAHPHIATEAYAAAGRTADHATCGGVEGNRQGSPAGSVRGGALQVCDIPDIEEG